MGPGSPLGQVMDRWNMLPRSLQMALAGILAGAIVIFYFVFMASSKPHLVTAFTGLQPEDTAAIADQLSKDGGPNELGGSGTSVAIPANKVAEVRIKLAQAGLPKGGSVGLEIFDKTNFGAADFVQQVNYQRGLEGELARSIDTSDGVKASRVHLNAVFRGAAVSNDANALLTTACRALTAHSQIATIDFNSSR